MNLQKNIRFATTKDTEAMLEIYKPSIVETPASFEIEMPSLQEFESRVIDIGKKFPWLVYETNNEVVGYAYASPHRSRCAYNWSVECTAYIKTAHHRKGIGKALYETLFNLLKKQGAVNVFAGITLPNPGSVGLHEAMGFTHIGTYKDVGFKMGKWWDVGWWQLQLQKPENPRNLMAITEIDHL